MLFHNTQHVIVTCVARSEASKWHRIRISCCFCFVGTAKVIVAWTTRSDGCKFVGRLPNQTFVLIWRARSVRVIISVQQMTTQISRSKWSAGFVEWSLVASGTYLSSSTLQGLCNKTSLESRHHRVWLLWIISKIILIHLNIIWVAILILVTEHDLSLVWSLVGSTLHHTCICAALSTFGCASLPYPARFHFLVCY